MRTRRTFAVIGLGLMLLFPATGTAQRAMVHGFGAKTCGAFVVARNEKKAYEESMFLSWLAGYVSGTNRAIAGASERDADIATGVDMDAMRVWVDKYCRDKPLDLFSTAVVNLVIELMQRESVRRRGGQ